VTEPVDILIQNAMFAKLASPNITTPPTAIAYPFVTFVPVVGTNYIDARPMLRAAPDNPSLANTGSNIYRGVFQVDAVTPDAKGEAPGIRLASLISARFPVGIKIPVVGGRFWVKCNDIPTIAAAVKDAPWVRFPVSIPYIVITN
jgi:hypothetical protein